MKACNILKSKELKKKKKEILRGTTTTNATLPAEAITQVE